MKYDPEDFVKLTPDDQRFATREDALNILANELTELWGEKCPDYDPECGTCEAWRVFERLAELTDSVAIDRETEQLFGA